MGNLNSKSSKVYSKLYHNQKLQYHDNNNGKNKSSNENLSLSNKRFNACKTPKLQESQNTPNSVYPNLNDNETEPIRLAHAHELYKILWGNNFSSPAEEILELGNAKVLDLGCGPGHWISDIAHDYPTSIFIGIDYFSMFLKNKPQNAEFLEYNILNGIPFPDNTFDYVHQRNLSLAYTEVQWSEVIEDIIRVTKPGGLIELSETDCEIYQGGHMSKLFEKKLLSYISSRGVNYNISKRLTNILDKANLIDDITSTSRSIPLNCNEGIVGKMGSKLLLDAIDASKSFIKYKEYDDMFRSISAEFNNPSCKAYLITSRTCARKSL